jgi:hypothetical protein
MIDSEQHTAEHDEMQQRFTQPVGQCLVARG